MALVSFLAAGSTWYGFLRSNSRNLWAKASTFPGTFVPRARPRDCTPSGFKARPSKCIVHSLAPSQAPIATIAARPVLCLSSIISAPSLAGMRCKLMVVNVSPGSSCFANLVSILVMFGKVRVARETESVSERGLMRPKFMILKAASLPFFFPAFELHLVTQSGQGTSFRNRATSSNVNCPNGIDSEASAARAASRSARSHCSKARAAARWPSCNWLTSPPCTNSSTVANVFRRHSSRTSEAPPDSRWIAR
mmetsp:Transcript_51826/g.110105  ORF Transcript_51826/g.110105 Transcript_51826/m.110105 type:complete len:251 (+) Transcript_51826:1404-2156(+)